MNYRTSLFGVLAIATLTFPAAPIFAQDRTATAAELRSLIEGYRQEVEALEAEAYAAGSEGDARNQLQLAQKKLEDLSALRDEGLAKRADSRGAIIALLPPLPEAAVPPPSAPTSAVLATPAVQPSASLGELTNPYLGGDRRVLTLPNAVMHPLDEDGKERELPVFSILYKLGQQEMDGQTYVAVGRTADRHEGWVARDQTEEWKSMLVLQYAPLGNRRPVVFWDRTDPLQDVLDSHFTGPQDAVKLYQDITDGSHDRDAVVAIEPARPIAADIRPYFMPIIDHVPTRFDDIDGTEVLLLELAMVNLNSHAREQVDTEADLQDADNTRNTEALKEFKTGVVFVVDATLSMGPYIEGVREFMRSFRQTTVDGGFADQMGFGLVGYRDSVEPDKRVEYTTRTFLSLETQVSDGEFEAAIDKIAASGVSTIDWREDAFAGIEDALTQTDWSEYDARYVVLVTDAGPRVLGDALARNAALGPRSIGRLAQRQDVSLSIVHMLTDEGAEDHRAAASAYAELVRTRGGTVPAYFTVRGDAPARFRDALKALGAELAGPLNNLSQGEAIATDSALEIFENDTFRALEGLDGAPVVIDNERGSNALADGIVSELFRFQQEYLGELDGGEAPDFYRAWVADRDLVNPRVPSMDVKVLITRDQLSDLTARLRDLVKRLDAKETGARDAFAAIVDVSSRAAFDPGAAVGDALMPSYIAALPYKSRFLSLKLDEWAGLGSQQQGEILTTVRDRINLFEEIARTEAGWLKLPGRDGGLAVYPLALDDLP